MLCMAARLRKCEYTGSSGTRPEALAQSTPGSPARRAAQMKPGVANVHPEDILSSPRSEISAVIRQGLKNALIEDFDVLKSGLRALKAEIVNNTVAVRSEIERTKGGH